MRRFELGLSLFLLVSAEAAAVDSDKVDLRTYWCEGLQGWGAGASWVAYGAETRIGVFDHSKAGAKLALLSCVVDARPAFRVRCRALRGQDNVPEALSPVALSFGTPATVAVRGEAGQALALTFVAYAPGSGPDFGTYDCPFPASLANAAADDTPDVSHKILIQGVDAEAGDPEIWVMSNGSLNLYFQVFPPSRVTTDAETERYQTFDRQLERELGVAVTWEDRELFHIAAPRADTIERMKAFVHRFVNSP